MVRFEDLFAGERPRSLRALRLPPTLIVLVLGPHPDDFDAVAVTLRLLSENGNPIHVGVVRSGSGVQDSYCSPPTLDAKAAVREAEQRRSCRFFGLPEESLTFLQLDEDEEEQPKESPENLRRLREFILSVRPDVVVLPHGDDTNAGHQRIFSMFAQIAQGANRPIAALLNRDPKTITMRIDLYTEFGKDEAVWKARMLRFHDSQQSRNLNTRGSGFDERILNTNRQIAREISCAAEYAEAFELLLYGVPQGEWRPSAIQEG
jgi:LmbE family N-acetylglucosaminyl deacetylase